MHRQYINIDTSKVISIEHCRAMWQEDEQTSVPPHDETSQLQATACLQWSHVRCERTKVMSDSGKENRKQIRTMTGKTLSKARRRHPASLCSHCQVVCFGLRYQMSDAPTRRWTVLMRAPRQHRLRLRKWPSLYRSVFPPCGEPLALTSIRCQG